MWYEIDSICSEERFVVLQSERFKACGTEEYLCDKQQFLLQSLQPLVFVTTLLLWPTGEVVRGGGGRGRWYKGETSSTRVV